MTDWAADAPAATLADSWAVANRRFLSTKAWGGVLEGLGCTCRLAWNERRGEGALVPIFRRAGLRVGFLGFPVGSSSGSSDDSEEHRQILTLSRQLRLDIMRINWPVSAGQSFRGGIRQPDAWIADLASWDEGSEKRRARDVAFARRATSNVVFASSGVDAVQMYRMYAETVRAHGGNVRYTPDYFVRLASMSGAEKPIHIEHGRLEHGELLGWAVMAVDGDTGYYLHAAVSVNARSMGLSDLLLSRLMATAKRRGLRRFNLMTSPREQAGLLKFKCKWADIQTEVITQDLAASLSGRVAVELLQWSALARARARASK